MLKLQELRDTAIANGKLVAAVRAEYLRGKTAGLYGRVERSDTNEFERMTTEELRQYLIEQTHALEALGNDLSVAPKANAKLKH